MNITKLLSFGSDGQKAVSVINNPFGEKNVESIRIQYTTWSSKAYWYASVEFKNGRTKGEQQTPHVDTFEEVLAHLKQIFESVKMQEK